MKSQVTSLPPINLKKVSLLVVEKKPHVCKKHAIRKMEVENLKRDNKFLIEYVDKLKVNLTKCKQENKYLFAKNADILKKIYESEQKIQLLQKKFAEFKSENKNLQEYGFRDTWELKVCKEKNEDLRRKLKTLEGAKVLYPRFEGILKCSEKRGKKVEIRESLNEEFEISKEGFGKKCPGINGHTKKSSAGVIEAARACSYAQKKNNGWVR